MDMKGFFLRARYRYYFILGLSPLLVPELLKAYLLMPFPGSQELDSLRLVYFLMPWIVPLRIIGLILLVPCVVNVVIHGEVWKKVAALLLCLVSSVVYWLSEIKFSAAEIFKEPASVGFVPASESGLDPNTLVIGLEYGGIVKAYPVDYLAYHHRIYDAVGDDPVLVTYCTMCRTGGVFSPEVDGQLLHFDLIGASRYNAIFRDRETRSLWYQATGEAAVGPLAGKHLSPLLSEQVTLAVWQRKHPESIVFRADEASRDGYKMMEGFGGKRAPAEQNDSYGWKDRSWVVGVKSGEQTKAYPWSALVRRRVISDVVGGVALLIGIEDDLISVHAWERSWNGRTLEFALDAPSAGLTETREGTHWTWDGVCIGGVLKGTRLQSVQASVVYWHAWRNFHPKTLRWSEPTLASGTPRDGSEPMRASD